MSYPTPDQPAGSQFPPGTPGQPYPAPTQPGYPAQPGPAGQYPGQPGQPYPGQYPPQPARSRGPLVAWIAAGVVVVVAVVLVIVFTVGGGGGGNSADACKTLETKVQALAPKLESDASSTDLAALKGDIDQLASLVDDAAGSSSGQTSTDLKALASDLHQASTAFASLDINAIESMSDKISSDGDKVDQDCSFSNDPFEIS